MGYHDAIRGESVTPSYASSIITISFPITYNHVLIITIAIRRGYCAEILRAELSNDKMTDLRLLCHRVFTIYSIWRNPRGFGFWRTRCHLVRSDDIYS